MKQQLKKAFSHKLNVFGKSIPTMLVAALLIGGGSAAVTTLVSQQTTGTVQVDRGMNYTLTGVTGNQASMTSNTAYTVNPNSGGTFSSSLQLENLANEETEPIVEVVTLDADTDLEMETLENVTFKYEKTSNSATGDIYTEYVSFSPQGDKTTDGSLPYLHIGEADVSSDSSKEVIVCVGDNPGSNSSYGKTSEETEADGDMAEATNYDPGESWSKTIEFDTSSSFPSTQVTTTTELVTLFNPAKGALSETAAACPQFS